jgi:hypothetical protein
MLLIDEAIAWSITVCLRMSAFDVVFCVVVVITDVL